MASAAEFLSDQGSEEQPPASGGSASDFLNSEDSSGPAKSAGDFLSAPDEKEKGGMIDRLTAMLFSKHGEAIEKARSMVGEAAKKMVPTFVKAANAVTKPITQPFKDYRDEQDPTKRFVKGMIAGPESYFNATAGPLFQEIPGTKKLGEMTADAIQPEKAIEEEAMRSGKLPYGMISKRVAGEMIGEMIPKTPADVGMLWAFPEATSVVKDIAGKALPALTRPLLRGGVQAAEEAVPTMTKEMMLPDRPGGMDIGESPATVKAIEKIQPGSPVVPKEADPVQSVSDQIVRKFRGEKEPYTLDRLYQDTINRFHSIEKYSQIAEEGPDAIKLRPGENPGLLARSYLGMTGKVNTFLEHQTFRIDPEGNVQFQGPGLKTILEPMQDHLDDMSNYLVARRAMSLSERQIESGVDIGDAQQAVLKLEAKYPLVKEIAESHIQKWQDDLLQYLKDSGRIGDRQYTAIKAANDFYAPMQRVLDNAEDPLAFNMKNREVFNRIVSPIKEIKGSEAKVLDPLEAMVKNAFHIIDAADRNRVAKSLVSLRTKNPALADSIEIVPRPGKNTITAYFGGQPVHAKIPQELLSSMRGLSEEQAGWLQKIFQFPTSVLRAGATLSPEFAVRNPIRDQWSAMVNSKYGFKPFYDSVRGAFSIANADDSYWRWQASGGAQSFLVSMDRTLNDLLWEPPKGYWQGFGEYAKNPLKVFQDVSEGLESPTRVGLFKTAKEAGTSDLEAGFESREGTVDFARRGMQARGLNSLYAFFNARLQGADKTIRVFKENPAKASLLASPLTAASVALYMANRTDPEWKEVPQWQKDLFWMAKVKGKWLRIPKGDLGIVFGSSAEHVLDYLDNHEPGKMAAFAFDTLSNVSPVDFNNGGMVPTAIKPVIENLANYNYFLKRQIVSEGKQNLLPEFQYSRFDTETAKQIGKLLGVSPSKVQNLILGYTGGMGRLALQTADVAGRATGVFPKDPAQLPTHPEDIPGIKGFFAKDPSGSSSQSVNDFYQSWETIQQAKATMKQYPEKMAEISQKYPEWRAFGLFNSTNRGLNDLRKLRDVVVNSKMDSDLKETKLQSINAQMTKMARVANDTLLKMKQNKKTAQPAAAAASAGAFLEE